jgi:WD40 repeat protein
MRLRCSLLTAFLLAALVELETEDCPARQPQAPAARERRTDWYGDPLPERALVRLGTLRLRHAGRIHALAFFPDGKTLASGGSDNVVRVWDGDTGRQRHRLEGHKGPVESLAVSADGRLLASGGGYSDPCIHLWDAVKGTLLRRLQTPKGVYHVTAVALSPDGKTLAGAADDRTIRLWDLATGQSRRFADQPVVNHLAFSHDGKYLLARGTNGDLRVRSVATGQVPDWLARLKVRVTSAGFTADGKTLVIAGGRAVRWWGLTPGKEVRRARWSVPDFRAHPAFPRRLPPPSETQQDDEDRGYHFGRFSPDGKMLGKFEMGLVFWDSISGKEVMKFPELLRLEATAFSPDSKRLAGAGQEGIVLVWDLEKQKLVPPHGHLDRVRDITFLQGGKVLATVSADRTMRLWDAATGKELHRVGGRPQGVTRIAPLKGATELVMTGGDHTIRVYDTVRNQELHRFPVKEGLYRAVPSPDGSVVAVVLSDGLQLRDARKGTVLGSKLPHPGSIWGMAFRPDGKVVAVGINGGSVYLWDVATGKLLRVLEGGTGTAASLAFSPDGMLLAAGYGDQRIRLWEPATGKRLRELTRHTGWVNALAFSPDGARLASGSSDHTILLWDTAALRGRAPECAPAACLRGHQSEVRAVAFSPDGRRLASGSADTTALVWELPR